MIYHKNLKIKIMFKTIIEKLKAWAIGTALPWFKKEWMQVVNLFVIWVAQGTTKGLLHLFLGTWFIVMVVYYIGWKFLGIGKLINKAPVIDPPVPTPDPAPVKTKKK
jgi:hypothetical protein